MFYIINNYKDAKNFESLMSPNLTPQEIEFIRNDGATSGGYKLLQSRCIDGIELEERPFHCVDDSRNKYLLYVNNDWKIDKNGNKIINETIKKISGAYDIDISREDSASEVERKYRGLTELLDLEKKGKKIILKELNKKTLIKNTVK